MPIFSYISNINKTQKYLNLNFVQGILSKTPKDLSNQNMKIYQKSSWQLNVILLKQKGYKVNVFF